MIDDKILKNEERAVFALRSLYKRYGYLPFKMSKFEEYDLYLKNKDFLVSDRVITFNDVSGKLLALKPDVTLSIIKNTRDLPGVKQKVYYNENVYRVSSGTGHFGEIMQAGLECIGDIDITDIFEVCYLAAESLRAVSESFVLDVSHMGVLSAILDEVSADPAFRRSAITLIGEKNKHELTALCESFGVLEASGLLSSVIDMYGRPDKVISDLKNTLPNSVIGSAAFSELSELVRLLSGTPVYDRIRLDFSVVNDMSYYNGVLLRGFLEGISEGVLSGGEYDSLMKRVGRDSRAVGFALYLDLLEAIDSSKTESDVDVLIVYDDSVTPDEVLAKKTEFLSQGLSVQAQCAVPENVRYGRVVFMSGENKND